MGGDQIACELATRRGLDLKPFALKGCPPMLLTELRVVFILKLSMNYTISIMISVDALKVIKYQLTIFRGNTILSSMHYKICISTERNK